MKEILFVVLNEYADWEAAPLAAAINEKKDFCVKTVSLTKKPVVSMGGFSVLPDYDLSEAMEKDFIGLILVGGKSWRTEDAKRVSGLVRFAVSKNTVVAAICDASVYLGAMGILNDIEHTSNQLENLQSYAGDKYTGAGKYKNQQTVRCGQFITANGTANLEFAKEVLLALDVMTDEEAGQWYRFCKWGYYEAIKNKEQYI